MKAARIFIELAKLEQMVTPTHPTFYQETIVHYFARTVYHKTNIIPSDHSHNKAKRLHKVVAYTLLCFSSLRIEMTAVNLKHKLTAPFTFPVKKPFCFPVKR